MVCMLPLYGITCSRSGSDVIRSAFLTSYGEARDSGANRRYRSCCEIITRECISYDSGIMIRAPAPHQLDINAASPIRDSMTDPSAYDIAAVAGRLPRPDSADPEVANRSPAAYNSDPKPQNSRQTPCDSIPGP